MNHPSTHEVLQVFGVISDLAKVYRHNAMTFDPQRKENVAEHSYALATLGCALAAELELSLDVGKVAQFALVHDLTEIFMEEGDISVYAAHDLLATKKTAEETALEQIRQKTDSLPWISRTLEEYEAQTTPESRFVYALDKMVVHMIITINDQHHVKPTRARYLETETIARDKIQRAFPRLLPYFEDLCQMFKARPHLFEE